MVRFDSRHIDELHSSKFRELDPDSPSKLQLVRSRSWSIRSSALGVAYGVETEVSSKTEGIGVPPYPLEKETEEEEKMRK